MIDTLTEQVLDRKIVMPNTKVAICIQIAEFCIKNDGSYTKHDELCIKQW